MRTNEQIEQTVVEMMSMRVEMILRVFWGLFITRLKPNIFKIV